MGGGGVEDVRAGAEIVVERGMDGDDEEVAEVEEGVDKVAVASSEGPDDEVAEDAGSDSDSTYETTPETAADPEEDSESPAPTSLPPGAVAYRPGMTLEDMERDVIAAVLDSVEWNRRQAAEILGIGERTLYRKVRKYGLEEEA